MLKTNIIERAFELAKSGDHRTVSEIGLRLNREHYSNVDLHLNGSMIRKQLNEIIKVNKHNVTH